MQESHANRFKIGEFDAGRGITPFLEREGGVISRLPMLVRPDGSIHQVKYSTDLLNFRLQSNDLYLVGPHGEIVPFIALAIRQKVIDALGTFFHIDAHFDSFAANAYQHGGVTRQLIEQFIKEGTPDSFRTLWVYIQGDINTFIYALANYFKSIAACIRPQGRALEDTTIYGPMTLQQYTRADSFIKASMAKEELRRLVGSSRSKVYSIDGDFVACRKEHREARTAQKFKEVMDYLLHSLEPEIENAGNPSRTVLYTASLDFQWVADIDQFLERFINEFYLRLIQAAPQRQAISSAG